MVIEDVANRGFNLLAVSLLGLGGLEFGAVLLQEQDLLDKVDDGGFLLIGLLAAAWYLWRRNRFRRSMIPLGLAAAAVGIQIVGLILERDDPKAFGDNIGGLLFFLPVAGLIILQFRRTAAIRASSNAVFIGRSV